jgi:hypothetical protein
MTAGKPLHVRVVAAPEARRQITENENRTGPAKAVKKKTFSFGFFLFGFSFGLFSRQRLSGE